MPNEKNSNKQLLLSKIISIMIIQFILINLSQCFNFKQLARSSVSKIINQRTLYSFIFDRSTNNSGSQTLWSTQLVSSSANISVDFPNQYTLAGLTCDSISIVSATQSYSPSGYSCIIDGTKAVFSGALTSVSDLYIKGVTVNYGNVLNPSPAIKTKQFTGYIDTDVAVSNGGTYIQLVSASFSHCALTFGNGGYVNQTSPAIFQITLLNPLNTSSLIKINFPTVKYWLNDISQVQLPIATGAMSCTGLSNVQSNLVCSGNYTAFSVQASSIFSSVIASGQTIKFQINSFVSPPTLQDIDSIKITSLTNSYEVDTCTTKVSGLVPKQFVSLSIDPIGGIMKVNDKVGIAINMTFSDTVNQYDIFRVTFPSSLPVTLNSVSISGSSLGTPTLSGSVLTVPMNVDYPITEWQNQFFVINFQNMTAPPSIKQSDSITVEVLRNGYQKMIGSATVTATQSTLDGTINVQSLLVNAKTNYVFSINLKDKLSSTGWLEITFPSVITLSATMTSISASGTGIKALPTVTVNLLQNKVVITSLATGSFISVQTFTLTLGLITNPGTIKPTSDFIITSYYQTGNEYLVAQGTITGITPTAGILTSSTIAVTKTSDIVMANPVSYTISFVTTYNIPQNGIIKLQIPSDIKIDLTNLESNCFQQINSTGSKISATCSGTLNSLTSKYEITISSIALTSNLVGNSTVYITFDNICTNPDTTRNILGFSINIYADGYLIEGANTGISTRAITPAQCQSVNVTRLSKKNSDITNYVVSLKQPSNLQASSYLIITIPTALQLNSNSTCYDLTGTVVIDCSFVDNLITVQFPASTIISNTAFGVTLTNIFNLASFQPLNDPFTLLTKTPDSINKYCQSTNTFLFQNNIASSFTSITGSFTPRMYNQITSLITTFKPSIRTIPSYIVVSLSAELKIETLACSFQGIISGICALTSTNMINISGTFNANQMQFTIGGLRAPKYNQSTAQFSSVSSFTVSNFKIDQSINLISFTVKCTLPCKTCSDSNFSECLSCYQDLTISTEIYYLGLTKFCYSICPDGFYENTNTLQCEACNSLCKTCQISDTNCTSCYSNVTAKYFYLTSSNIGSCLGSCPTYYYSNSLNICVPCQSPCNDCTSKTVCKNCANGFFMNQGQCQATCPTGTTISNTITRVCDLCSSVCATCSGNINNCLTCSPDAAYYNNSCTSVCPPPLVVNAGLCANCDSICKQCSIHAQNCTKCDVTSNYSYWYNFTCLNSCPQTYYNDLINGMCQLCQTLNIGCKYCNSVSSCISCDTGYIFLNNKCYNSTPTGYYNDNGYAKPCIGDCATCIDLATKCTSCKTLNLNNDNTCINPCPDTFIGENKLCIACQSPCLTCSNIKTNCTSCILNTTTPVFLNNYYCTSTCPDYTYSNSSTRKCQTCNDPCLKCSSQNECISCVNGKFLLGTACIGSCQDGFIGLNKICQPCGGNCATCQITQTRCKTCKPLFYLYNSSFPTCISDCHTVGLYPDLSTSICGGCSSSCVTCSNTSTTCLSCAASKILFQNQCITQCPIGYYTVGSSCIACPMECATCTTSSICQSCVSSYYLHLNYCVQNCPTQYPVITSDGRCQQCSQSICKSCNQNDYCLQCMQPYYLHLGKCVQHCPTNYHDTIDNTNKLRTCVYSPPSNTTNTTNTTTNTTTNATQQTLNVTLATKNGGNLFPVPFIIGATFVGMATIMSKFQNQWTFVSGVLYSLWGLIQWASVALMLWLFYCSQGWQHIQFYIIAGSFAFLYVLNLLAFLIQNIYLVGDISFKKWLNMNSNRCFYYFCSILSFLTTHKFKNVMFCKMFNFVFLKAKLDSIQQFRVFNAFSFLSFLSSGGILFGMGLIFVTYKLQIDQTLMAYIDATVLTAINIVLGIMNSRKDDDFFQQKTQDGYVVNKRIEDYDELLYGGTMPLTTQQKFDHNQITGKKLFSPYQTRYNHLSSQISQDSVRNISVQADPILGQQSRITHLNDSQMSDLNLFQQKEFSCQFDEIIPKVQVHDKSISMMQQKNQSISIQMDDISRNQISIQVQREREQVSVQYGANMLDQGMGMSRQQANISIQANPLHQQISIQYSAKPVFVNIDQEYKSGQYDQLQDSIQPNNASQSWVQQKSFQKKHSQVQSQFIQKQSQQHQPSHSQNQTYLTNRIKKPDALLKPQLELDINQRLQHRQVQLRRLQEQRIKQQRFQAVLQFQNNQQLNRQKQSQQLQDKIFLNRNNQNNKQVNQVYNNDEVNYQQSQTIMDSRFDIMNVNKKQFSSNQSRVQIKQQNNNQLLEQQNSGEKTQQQFIQMLSGKKYSQQQQINDQQFNQQNKYSQQNKHYRQQNSNINPNFNINKQNILKVSLGNQLQDSNQISLNLTRQLQPNQFKSINNNKQQNYNPKFKFQNKNQLYDSGTQQYQQPYVHNARGQLSQQYTKSISTKHMTTFNNKKIPLSNAIHQNQLIDSSQQIQNSFNLDHHLIQDIINAPIRPLINYKAKLTRMNSRQKHDSSMNQHQQQSNFPNFYSRNLKSATLVRNYDKQIQRNDRLEEFDDSDENQNNEDHNHQKQQPLPLPQRQFGNAQMNQGEQLQFGEFEKVLISPMNTEQLIGKPPMSQNLPRGINKKASKSGPKNRISSKSQNKSMGTNNRASSRQKQRPVYNQLLNPSTSTKNRNLAKQLQKEQKKAQNRKKNLQLMQGMLQRPSNAKKGYSKQQQEENKRNPVQKIYLNRRNFTPSK